MSLKSLVVCALLAATAGQAAAQSAPASTAPAGQDSAKSAKPARRDRNVIAQDELSAPERQSQSVLEVIRSLRPIFLNTRGTQSCLADKGTCSGEEMESGKVHASIDGNGVVALSELSTMHAANVIEIRYLNAGAAMQKFGGEAHQGPVILVKTIP